MLSGYLHARVTISAVADISGNSQLQTINTVLNKLARDDLEQWAGAVIVSRAGGYVERVEELSCTDSRLVA